MEEVASSQLQLAPKVMSSAGTCELTMERSLPGPPAWAGCCGARRQQLQRLVGNSSLGRAVPGPPIILPTAVVGPTVITLPTVVGAVAVVGLFNKAASRKFAPASASCSFCWRPPPHRQRWWPMVGELIIVAKQQPSTAGSHQIAHGGTPSKSILRLVRRCSSSAPPAS